MAITPLFVSVSVSRRLRSYLLSMYVCNGGCDIFDKSKIHKPQCGVLFTLEGKRPYGSGEQIKWEPSLLGNPSCQFWEIQSEAWPGDYYHLPRTVKEGIGRLHLMTTQTTRYRCNENHFNSRIANHQQHDISQVPQPTCSWK